MQTGIIRTWIIDRGFGFCVPDDGGEDVFVHVSQTGGRELATGQRVAFEIGVSERTGRPQAINVKVV
jgi:cold shock protein